MAQVQKTFVFKSKSSALLFVNWLNTNQYDDDLGAPRYVSDYQGIDGMVVVVYIASSSLVEGVALGIAWAGKAVANQ